MRAEAERKAEMTWRPWTSCCCLTLAAAAMVLVVPSAIPKIRLSSYDTKTEKQNLPEVHESLAISFSETACFKKIC